jgi:putative flippase GtrA
MMLFGRLFIFIFKTRYIHFFLIGTSGILLNLLVTWFLTEFVFGLERYFIAYIIGTAANLLYNFICNTVITFKTRRNHFVRLLRFVVYNLSMAIVQAAVVKYVTPLVGL